MTVGELMEVLRDVDPSLEVGVSYDCNCAWGGLTKVRGVETEREHLVDGEFVALPTFMLEID